MGKSMRFKTPVGKEISSKELEQCMRPMLEYSPLPPKNVTPPKDYREFEDRIVVVLERLLERMFGLVYHLDFDERTTLQKDASIDNLIEIGIKIEKKYKGKPIIINEQLNCFGFLKTALEKNYPFSQYAQDFLGIQIDFSDLSVPKRRVIGVQAAAVVLWFEKKGQISSTQQMRKEIWENKALVEFLELYKFQDEAARDRNPRVLENMIRQVNPVPANERKQWPSQRALNKDHHYSKTVLIPEIFSENSPRINYQKLRLAIMSIARVLSHSGSSQEEIINSVIVQAYRARLEFYPKMFVNAWIRESLSASGSIFTL